MTKTYQSIISLLTERGVSFETKHHEPTLTSEDAARIRGVALCDGAKALVLRGKKTGKHWLFVMPADRRLDSHKAAILAGESVSFAEDPEAVTGCVRGSVPPFGSVVGLQTFCDQRLAEHPIIHFNAGSLTDSITMAYADYERLEQPTVVDFVQDVTS
ncbi:MAG TPA: YbaK/EbsC family protein [Patescibacteria group bacterium]|nr:YbaK/EbsC family protein [Patescibacteria group bacterium]